MANLPKISIITIVYNNAKDIEFTMASVLNQTYPVIEYIVIDGLSTDGTVDIIKKYKNQLAIFTSEKDAGIYDAMNKGLKEATGDYVLFLNSGDALYDENTLDHVVKKGKNADIIYGETMLIDENRQEIGLRRHAAPKEFTWKSFKYGMNICHQAIYIKREIAVPYNENYKLSADIDWIIRCAKNAKTAVNVNELVARYLVGGLSQKRHRESLKERYVIFNQYYGVIRNFINHGIIAMRLFAYRLKHGKTRE
ncbi:glycosyltransferase family 2 protein [Sphingobacterium hungaricum]|uniref:Glycosyl transferase n=1 Tax=Sphingobacterium hungaricum TaxID=2082723 RepID=A0A928UZ14_9SPHI|nr:glycosyltransferase family 2 protein [Sphingobacterium hungaricum]MBE8713991.1 glycosyl transferase [Sphingobacterium hungaricum]